MATQRETLIQQIESRLWGYAGHVKAAKGTLSGGSEDFFREFLSIVLGCALENMNDSEQENFPAIDLGGEYEGGKLSIQVTSENTTTKVQRTLDKFFDHDLETRFTRLVVLLISMDKPPRQREYKLKKPFDFQPGRDIWDIPTLTGMIERLDNERLEDLHKYVEWALQGYTPAPPRDRLLDLPLRSAMRNQDFVGRVGELEQMDREFSRERMVVLSGLGGMGKTVLALRYAEQYELPGRRWAYLATFREDFRRTVLDEIAPQIPNMPEGLPEEEKYRRAMTVLKQCAEEDLLILDNADRETDLGALRADLSGLRMRVLVTTRTEDPGAIPIGPMEPETLRQIFRNHGANISEADMDALIDAVEGHTLTVDLMARSMVKGTRRTTAEKLLTALKKRDLAAGSFSKIGAAYPGARGQARINEHLKTVFHVASLAKEEQELLRFMTLLPENGMEPELILATQDDPDAAADILDELVDKGWLAMKNGLLIIHPVIRIVCREVLKPTDENCKAFLLAMFKQYDRNHYNKDRYRQLAELFTLASTDLEDRAGVWALISGHLWYNLGEARLALACNLRMAEKLEQSQPDSKALAVAYNNLGTTYGALGDHQKALEYQLKALAICEKVLPPDHPSLATSYDNVGCTYYAMENYQKALEYQLKALTIREKVLPPDHPSLATSYNNVGSTYGELGDHEKELEYKLKALAIREKVLPQDHPDLATSYNNVGGTYGELGDHQKALEYQQKALSICEKVLPEFHPDIAQSCNNLAWTYYELGQYEKALSHMRRAAQIVERSLPEGHPDRVNYRRGVEWMERKTAERANEQ